MQDIARIMAALPHRYPLLLVDRILEAEAGKRIVTPGCTVSATAISHRSARSIHALYARRRPSSMRSVSLVSSSASKSSSVAFSFCWAVSDFWFASSGLTMLRV